MDRFMLHAMLQDMLLARSFEERAAREYTEGNIAGFLHLYPGEEAVAVGVLHAAESSDYVVSTYREHVHALVRGIPARSIMAELFGRRDGCCRGMGGSMHLFDRERRFMGGYAIVGETFPVAVGLAYATAMRSQPEAVICFFGDGAVNQGTFHESLNMAALWNLPVLFVCENNHYQIGTEIHRHSAVSDVFKRACGYRIPAEKINGMDVLRVYEATQSALQRIREGAGPQFLEMETYRFRGHSMADAGNYRPQVEVEAYRRMDPLSIVEKAEQPLYPSAENIASAGPDTINGFSEHLRAEQLINADEIEQMKQQVEQTVEDAVDFARRSPEPGMEEALAALDCNRGQEVLI
ncbi:MAG TPA: pyruvate dehydrogenase (acetyl-transferring) E1 component subunit alpha [Gammaproteobacteria bacterium]|nr:pyruvate dehydrogenase (acetyl-transferring) E1 component subunit alpha [Gammaproteobacteria bacterium]